LKSKANKIAKNIFHKFYTNMIPHYIPKNTTSQMQEGIFCRSIYKTIHNNNNSNKEFKNISNFLKSPDCSLQAYKALRSEEKALIKSHIPLDSFIAASKAIPVTQQIKQIFDKRFGENKYIFVSIGRSPAMIGKVLEHLGVEVKYIPLSGRPNISELTYNGFHTSRYIKYLKNQGLTAQNLKNSGKTAVFCDYTAFGETLKTVIKFTKDYLHIPRNLTAFKSLNRILLAKNSKYASTLDKANINKIEEFCNYYWNCSNAENFSHIPKLSFEDIDHAQRTMKKFRPRLLARLYDFCVMQKLEEKGLLVNSLYIKEAPQKGFLKNYLPAGLNKIKSLIRAAK